MEKDEKTGMMIFMVTIAVVVVVVIGIFVLFHAYYIEKDNKNAIIEGKIQESYWEKHQRNGNVRA